MDTLLILWGDLMYKQVFDYNGKPYLIKIDKDGNLLEKDLIRQKLYQFTEIMPPSNLYPPRKFDGENWHGATVEDYEENNRPSQITPEPLDLIVAGLQLQLTKSNSRLKKTEKQLAESMLEIAKLKRSE